MARIRTPFANADAYKLSHWIQYPDDVRYVYSNFTPRKNLLGNMEYFVFFGLQAFMKALNKKFKDDFFDLDAGAALRDFGSFYQKFFGKQPTQKEFDAVLALHDLGYLPLEILALPEGSAVHHGVV